MEFLETQQEAFQREQRLMLRKSATQRSARPGVLQRGYFVFQREQRLMRDTHLAMTTT